MFVMKYQLMWHNCWRKKVSVITRDLFGGLNTSFLQRKYFQEHFGLIVSQPWEQY